MISIGKALADHRTRIGLSQSELARRSGVPQRNISHWEAQRGIPDIYSGMRLARAMGMTLDELTLGVFEKREMEAL